MFSSQEIALYDLLQYNFFIVISKHIGYLFRLIPTYSSAMIKLCKNYPCELCPEQWDFVLASMLEWRQSQGHQNNFSDNKTLYSQDSFSNVADETL